MTPTVLVVLVDLESAISVALCPFGVVSVQCLCWLYGFLACVQENSTRSAKEIHNICNGSSSAFVVMTVRNHQADVYYEVRCVLPALRCSSAELGAHFSIPWPKLLVCCLPVCADLKNVLRSLLLRATFKVG